MPLENNFIENEDYKILSSSKEELASPFGEASSSIQHGGQNKETILLNVDTFKNLCMISKTPQGKEIRKYYIKMEQILHEYLKETMEKQAKEIQELQQFREIKYEEVQKTGHVYIISTDRPGVYKCGKTGNTTQKRIKQMQTNCVDDIQILHDQLTSNENLLENIAHYTLDRYRCNSNREHFRCNLEHMKNIISVAGRMVDVLKSSYQNITIEEMNDHIPLDVSSIRNQDLVVLIENVDNHVKQIENDIEEIENNDFYNWLDENIEYSPGNIIELKDICFLFSNKTLAPRSSNKFRKEIEKYIKEKFKNVSNIFQNTTFNGKKFKGWFDFTIKETV